MMRSLLAAVVALGLAACADGGTTSIESTPSAEPVATEGPSGLAASSESPGLIGGATITGVLSADSIEGGCVVLEADDSTRYEVIWPDGWSVSPELDLMDEHGEVVAEGGDLITVRGRIADDMASICQIGQIFEATEVTVSE
jgi:hypothetical protein